MVTEVDFSYGDLRIDEVVKGFYNSIIDKASICIRAIAGCRKREVAFHRLIKNKKFTAKKMIQEAAQHSKQVCEDSSHILCIQDTTELKCDVECATPLKKRCFTVYQIEDALRKIWNGH